MLSLEIEKIGDKYFKTIKGVGYKFVNPDK